MPRATQKSYYWIGFRTGLPFLLVVMPFGMLFGVVATEAGFTSVQTMAFSSVVFAGAGRCCIDPAWFDSEAFRSE
jgi:predicted branched-subunit amino acid permease